MNLPSGDSHIRFPCLLLFISLVHSLRSCCHSRNIFKNIVSLSLNQRNLIFVLLCCPQFRVPSFVVVLFSYPPKKLCYPYFAWRVILHTLKHILFSFYGSEETDLIGGLRVMGPLTRGKKTMNTICCNTPLQLVRLVR